MVREFYIFIFLKKHVGFEVHSSITQKEESKIDYDYVIMMRNNKFKHTVEKLQTIQLQFHSPLNYFFLLVLSLWNLIDSITSP